MTNRDCRSLNEESNEIKSQLSLRGKGNTQRNHEDNETQSLVGVLNPCSPGDKEDGNGGKRLQHLDVMDAEVKISLVAEDQASTKEDANGKDGAQEHVFSEVDIIGGIQEVCCSL